MEYLKINDVLHRNTDPIVLCIGKLDGVHLGHQHLLHAAQGFISDNDMLAVMTFSAHPRWILEKNPDFEAVLTPLKEKQRLLQMHGVKRMYEVQFSPEYASISPESFVLDHLSRLNIKRIVVGEDFGFGKGRSASAYDLRDLCQKVNIPVTIIPLVRVNGNKISSTDIRTLIQQGHIEAARLLLGRDYRIRGNVITGDQVGRTLGFPTANLETDHEYVNPAPGVYIGMVALPASGQVTYWNSLISAGYRPTVGGESYKIEAYLMDFTGDLYGQSIEVTFIKRVRDEIHFPALDDLILQMKKDESDARVWFGMPLERKILTNIG